MAQPYTKTLQYLNAEGTWETTASEVSQDFAVKKGKILVSLSKQLGTKRRHTSRSSVMYRHNFITPMTYSSAMLLAVPKPVSSQKLPLLSCPPTQMNHFHGAE
jgi:hypothetical protein